MRMLTLWNGRNQNEKLMSQEDYIPNTAQKRLAEEVTQIVHGEDKLQMATCHKSTRLDLKQY